MMLETSHRQPKVTAMKIIALCHTCCHQHNIEFDPRLGPGAAFDDWLTKHPDGHLVDFMWPGRQYKQDVNLGQGNNYLHNADIKPSYVASSAVTMTLASLAASSSLLAGRQSTAIDNTSNKYVNYFVTADIKAADANHFAGRIEFFVVGPKDDSTWPDAFGATDAARSVTSDSIKNTICKPLAFIAGESTNDRVYPLGPVSVAAAFGADIAPRKFLFWLTHTLHTSTNPIAASGHLVSILPYYFTSV
jgi:hypothetical protein